MEAIHLNKDQQLYLQEIFDYYHEHGEWPTHKYLERRFIQTHPDMDVEEIVQSLPEGLTNPMNLREPNSKAILTVPAMYQCQGSRQDLNAFVTVVGQCVTKYFNPEDDEPQISSDDLSRNLGWGIEPTRKAGLLLRVEPHLWSTFSGPEGDGSWKCLIAKEVRRLRKVRTIEEYLEKRELPRKVRYQPIATPIKGSISIATDDLQVHPEILSKCWDLYTAGKYDDAILNATKAVEVAVRNKANLPQSSVGVDVINTAFSVKKPLLRYSKVDAEQEGIMSLLRGVIQVFKNPQSHRFVGVQNKAECLSVLLMCSTLLYVVDNAEYLG